MDMSLKTRQGTVSSHTHSGVRNLKKPEHSKKQVNKAGKIIRGHIPYTNSIPDDLVESFNIAHNWRVSHIYPMYMVGRKLRAALDAADINAITASRLKRMQSIRNKLFSRSLCQIQDIAGCRAIVQTVAEVDRVAHIYNEGKGGYVVHKVDDYMNVPRDSGYRGYHSILKFQGLPDREKHNHQRIELQIRTRLQHSWATAVEAVGLYRNEDMKGGQGNKDWLRLFALMSDVIAEKDGLSSHMVASDRNAEIVELSTKLEAVVSLENINQAIRYVDNSTLTSQFKYLIIQFNHKDKTVTVRPFTNYSSSEGAYFNDEMQNWNINTVLVEMDRVIDLKQAYPNYFLDVRLFTDELKIIHPYEKAVKVNSTIAQWAKSWTEWRNK